MVIRSDPIPRGVTFRPNRAVGHHLSTVPAVERSRHLGDRRRDAGRNHGGQRPLQHRQYHSPRPCLGSGRKRATHRRALGRSRGGFSSKLHCLSDALGRPLAFHLTVGEAADCTAYGALTGLPERALDALLADKGHDADAIRADLTERSIEAVIPRRSNRRVKIEHDRTEPPRDCRRLFGLSYAAMAVRPAWRSSALRLRQAGCCRWARAGGGC